jgi:endo-1,4-beta-xylanase
MGRMYLKVALENTPAIALLTWGMTDRFTWLDSEGQRRDGLPERRLPFDAEMQPVAGLGAGVEALRRAPLR